LFSHSSKKPQCETAVDGTFNGLHGGNVDGVGTEITLDDGTLFGTQYPGMIFAVVDGIETTS